MQGNAQAASSVQWQDREEVTASTGSWRNAAADSVPNTAAATPSSATAVTSADVLQVETSVAPASQVVPETALGMSLDRERQCTLPAPPATELAKELPTPLTEAGQSDEGRLLREFLLEQGYTSPTSRRRSCCRYSYPVHSAVRLNDVRVLQILLAAKADVQAKDSNGLTATELARRCDKHGSRQAVLNILGTAPRCDG